ncbi:MAG: type II secretion system F family protein [Sedimentisphaerales bacterium]|nr:type II secretion system F family protein [Sedimentisphaerales bacterium]
MILFTYQAATLTGTQVHGTIEAMDRRTAVAALAERGEFVTRLEAGSAKQAAHTEDHGARSARAADAPGAPRWGLFQRRRISGKDILSFISQLSIALRSGLPLLDCLHVIHQQTAKPAMRKLLTDLSQWVSGGDSLSDAMAKRPDVFRPLHCALIRVGETGGLLEETSAQLVGLLSREEKIKSHMKNASAYPLFVLAIGFVSVMVIVTWLLPKITGTIFAEGIQMPWPTRLLLGVSDFCRSYYGWVLLGALLAGGLLARRQLRTGRGRLWADGWKLKIPVLGPVLQSIAVGRFARTFGSLTKGGIVILEALKVVRDTLGNEVLSRDIDQVIERVRTGDSIAKPLAESGRFPPLLVQIVSVGEQTGKLDELLLNAAETFDAQADAAITRFMAIMPAVLVLLLAMIVAFIIVATLLPIVSMQLGVSGF